MGKLFSVPGRKRAVVVHAVGGYVNTGILIIQGLLLIPLYLNFIGSHMYGLWLASGGILGMLGLVNFGVSSLVTQRIAHAYGKQNLVEAGAYYFNGVILYLGICLLYGLAGWLVSLWLPDILKITGESAELLRHCFQLGAVAMVIGIFNECLRSFAQALLRPLVPVLSIAVGRILGIGGTVWMLFHDYGLWAIPIGTLIVESVIFFLNLFHSFMLFQRLSSKVKFDQNIIKEYMQTSPALLMARVGGTLSQESEPLLITLFLSSEVTTAYMVARRAADIVFRMLSVIVGSTMGPFAHLVGNDDSEKIIKMARNLLFISCSLGVIGFAAYVGANQFFLSLWVGSDFAMNLDIILFIGLGFLARSFRGLITQMLYGLGDFIHTSMVILLEGLVRIALAVGLVSTIGIIGIPLAFSFSSMIAILFLGSRLYKRLLIPVNLFVVVRFLFTVAVVFSTSLAISQINIDINSWIGFGIYLMIILVIVLAIYTIMNWSRCREAYRIITT